MEINYSSTQPNLYTIGSNKILDILDVTAGAALSKHMSSVQLVPNDVLSELGVAVGAVYFPTSGIVSIVTEMEDGATVQSLAIGCEGAVGLTCALGTGTSQSRAVVLAPGSAIKISAAHLRHVSANHPSILGLALRYAQSQVAQLHQAAACIATHTLEQRLARWLLTCQDLLRSDVIAVTQEYIALMLGVQRTSLNAAARELKRRGCVEYARGRVNISNRIELESTCCECYRVKIGFMRSVD